MLVVVTVLAVFLAYPISWIRQRHQFIYDEQEFSRAAGFPIQVATGAVSLRAPPLLRPFGEKGWHSIQVCVEGWHELSRRDRERLLLAKKLFPEARSISAEHHRDGRNFTDNPFNNPAYGL